MSREADWGREMRSVLMHRYKRFNFDHLLGLADALCQYDEPLRALRLLECIPGHLRQYLPERVNDLRLRIAKSIITPSQYVEGSTDTKGSYEAALEEFRVLPRARIVEDEVRLANEAGFTPHIVDHGPGHYWLPIGLRAAGHRFTYRPVTLDPEQFGISREHVEPVLKRPEPDAPVFYVAFEIIEHVLDPRELYLDSLRVSHRTPSVVFCSTPQGTFWTETEPWEQRRMGHLRTYTQTEFVDEMRRVFPYCDRWQFFLENPILLGLGFSEDVPWRKPAAGG